MSAARRCLSLVKGRERFVFWYSDGQETDVLASFIDLAARPDSRFDWYDAAVLSFQMGRVTQSPSDTIVV